MPWVLRGLRDGVVTTAWPGRGDDYFDAWHGVAEPRSESEPLETGLAARLIDVCPTGAVGNRGSALTVDQGGCIGCGNCIAAGPQSFRWREGSDLARLHRGALVAPRGEGSDDDVGALRAQLSVRTRALGRSVHIRHVDAGSDGAEEWEIAALLNPVYDIHRLGMFFTASPRHADILLVTGIGATGMRDPLARTLEAMPNPVVIVAVGTDACSGGLLASSCSGSGGVDGWVEVDVWVPGSPPPPFAILHGLLLALGRLPERLNGSSS